MRILAYLGLISVAACASTDADRAAVNSVEPGMSRGEVFALLGDPVARSFRDHAEALQYCRDGGLGNDYNHYTTVWLLDGKVKALTQQSKMEIFTNCRQAMPEVDWGQVPPDISVELR